MYSVQSKSAEKSAKSGEIARGAKIASTTSISRHSGKAEVQKESHSVKGSPTALKESKPEQERAIFGQDTAKTRRTTINNQAKLCLLYFATD